MWQNNDPKRNKCLFVLPHFIVYSSLAIGILLFSGVTIKI